MSNQWYQPPFGQQQYYDHQQQKLPEGLAPATNSYMQVSPSAQALQGQPNGRYAGQDGSQASTNSTTTITTQTNYVANNQQPPLLLGLQVPQPYAPPTTFDYNSLKRDPPPPAQPTAVDYNSFKRNPPLALMVAPNATHTNTIQSSTVTRTSGGRARQAAAARGNAELQRFDRRVQDLLMTGGRSQCRRGFSWYKCEDGYLCGGGQHFVSDEDVDLLVDGMVRQPYIEDVNIDGCRSLPPPMEGWHEPMHWSPAKRDDHFLPPMPLKYDGTPWETRSRGPGRLTLPIRGDFDY